MKASAAARLGKHSRVTQMHEAFEAVVDGMEIGLVGELLPGDERKGGWLFRILIVLVTLLA